MKDLAIAYGIQKKSKKKSEPQAMANGGEVMQDRPDVGWGAVIHKAQGGMVEQSSAFDHKDLARAVIAKMSKDDDILSIDESEMAPDDAMPDDTSERMDEMSEHVDPAPEDDRKNILNGVMKRRR